MVQYLMKYFTLQLIKAYIEHLKKKVKDFPVGFFRRPKTSRRRSVIMPVMQTQMLPKTAVLVMMAVFMGLSPAVSETTLLYRENAGDTLIFHHYTITPTESGWIYVLDKKENNRTINITFVLDHSLSTVEWTYRNPEEEIMLKGVRKGDIILLTGTDKNDRVEKEFEVGDVPWKQILSLDMKKFAVSGKERLEFYAIGAEGPGAKKIAKFKAEFQERETISVNGQAVEAVHLRFSLTGLRAALWKGDYWFRIPDGLFVMYKGRRGPGTPLSVTELIRPDPKFTDKSDAYTNE